MARTLSLVVRNLVFTVVVPGLGERTLRRRFGRSCLEYRRTVPRWIPRPPHRV